eukprot:scaffold7095_cov386-Prasinococcus_capsulatus_cf.AAC.2
MGTGINDGERSRSGSAGGVSSLAGASGGAGVGGVWLSGGGDGHELGDARVQAIDANRDFQVVQANGCTDTFTSHMNVHKDAACPACRNVQTQHRM